MPDPENESRLMVPSDFLASIEDEALRARYADLLEPLIPFAESIHRGMVFVANSIPELLVRKNAPIDATEVSELAGQIRLADGLLKESLAIESKALTVDLGMRLPRPFGAMSVAKIGVLWSYAHELFHYLRRHELVGRHFGRDAATGQALEYDADLCAAAAVYRCVQRRPATGDAFQAKRAVLMNLYWHLREYVDRSSDDFGGSANHPHAAARLQDTIGKLAMLNDTGVADTTLRRPEAVEHLGKLYEVLHRLERARSRTTDDHGNATRVHRFVQSNQGLLHTASRVRRWDEISPLIDRFAILPRDLVDDEQAVAFIGEQFSLPRS